MSKQCKICEDIKPLNQFRVHKKRGRWYTQRTCSQCLNEKQSEMYGEGKISEAIPYGLLAIRYLQKKHRKVFKIDGIPHPRADYTDEEKLALVYWKLIIAMRQHILIAQGPKEFQKGPHRRKT